MSKLGPDVRGRSAEQLGADQVPIAWAAFRGGLSVFLLWLLSLAVALQVLTAVRHTGWERQFPTAAGMAGAFTGVSAVVVALWLVLVELRRVRWELRRLS